MTRPCLMYLALIKTLVVTFLLTSPACSYAYDMSSVSFLHGTFIVPYHCSFKFCSSMMAMPLSLLMC